MRKEKRNAIELRNYELNPYFPVKLLTGKHWIISDTPAENLHFHNCLEIGMCHSDHGTIRFHDASFQFCAGDVSIISCDIPHTTYSAVGTASLWSYLFVDLSMLLHPYSALSSIAELNILNKLEHNFHAIFSHRAHAFIHEIVQEIIGEISSEKDYYEDSVRSLFAALSIKLLREYDNRPDDLMKAGHSFSIKPALDYIRSYYMQNFDIPELAKRCRLSESHFRKVFTETIGQSPLEYINRIRIEKACTLLRISELSVLGISEAVGFGSLSSFNRHFLGVMGMSPSCYRQENSTLKNYSSIIKYNGWLLPEKL